MIRYVDNPSSVHAREICDLLTEAHQGAGILFVSVQPSPIEGGHCTEFHIVLGVKPGLTRETARQAVESFISKLFKAENTYPIDVYAGYSGKAVR